MCEFGYWLMKRDNLEKLRKIDGKTLEKIDMKISMENINDVEQSS